MVWRAWFDLNGTGGDGMGWDGSGGFVVWV